MSDSDEDIMAESVHRLRHNIMNSEATKMNNTNITSFSYRNNTTSTFKSTYNRQINGLQGTNQEYNKYYRRETSPMSLKSFRDSRLQNFSNYPSGMSSHRSVYNGRSGSPMSMRSIDSNVSAVDIAQAFKNAKFNNYDLRLIKEAYNKFMKNRTRRRIEKRKNLKLFLKGHRRKPGDDDSGEQGSDSSLSSDDCRSSRSFYNGKRPGPRSTTTDITHIRSSIRNCDMYRDCTDTLKQTRFQNIFALNNSSVVHEKHDAVIQQNQKCSSTIQKISQQNTSNTTLRERFTKGANSFLLPSQRFNKSVVNSNNTKTSTNQRKCIENVDKNNKINQLNIDSESEKEEIFFEKTTCENPQHVQQKRILEYDEATCSDKKRYKAASPIKQNDVTLGDFHFKKPQMPARKSANCKRDSLVPDRIIAMSKPLPDSIHLDSPNKTSNNLDHTHNKPPVNSTEIDESSNQSEITQNTSNVLMRPSFIKRKLFTQKLDVAENKLNSDYMGANSPQTKLYSGVREKNKVRKLVTSQSCLSRDILCDDNMLDLIHKIVPPDQINVTTASNKREINKTNENEKWDVTSVISTCNIGDVSDTFTDEEIFKAPSNLDKRPKIVQKEVESAVDSLKNNKPKLVTPCKVVVQKLLIANSKVNQREIEANKLNCANKKTVSSCIKSFWDTDFESDMEDRSVPPWQFRKCVGKDIEKETICNNTMLNVNNKKNNTRGTILTIRSLQNKNINSSMRSDISQVSKKTIIQENNDNNIIAKTSDSNKEPQTNKNLGKDTKNKKAKPNKKDSKDKLENENIKQKSAKTRNKSTISQTAKKENTFNTSRESLRLKEKNEKKELEKRSRQRPRISKENDDPLNLNNTKSRNNKGRNNKNNNNNNMKNNNNKTSTNSIKKNNTINQPKLQTPKKKQQTRNLFATPVTDSSFNISNRSLRVRHSRTFKLL